MRKIIIIFFSQFLFAITALQAQEFLRWSDEFNGNSLDTAKWEYQLGDGCPNLCGWGNAESQYYTKSAILIENGLLKVKAKKENTGNSTYTSGRIRSMNKFDFASGRIEVRARMPIGKGYWPAVWFLPTQNYYGAWPLSGEIDLLECKGQEPRNTYGTIHYGAYAPNNKYLGASYTLPSDSFTSGFHVFSLEWSKDSIRWYVDGNLFSLKTRNNLTDFWWPYDHNFHALINLAVGGNFLGYPDASTPDTATLQVDYIRVYQNLDQIFISGPDAVLRKQSNLTFYTQNIEGASYNWEVPKGASILSGANTASIQLNWTLNTDSIFVTITHLGKSRKLFKRVMALPDTCEGLVDDVETIRTFYWVGGNGTYKAGLTNPAKDQVNNSNSVNRYYRNAGVSYDALLLHTDLIHDAAPFEESKLVLSMKVYTTAPVGTEVNLNFENRNRATLDYPSGRRCVLQAKTTKTRAWEELKFNLILRPDLATPSTQIDQLVLLFAPNTNSSDVYYFDEIGIKETPCKELASGGLDLAERNGNLRVYPNPFKASIQLEGNTTNMQLTLLDIQGRVMLQCQNLNQLNLILGDLPCGIYYLNLQTPEAFQSVKLIKSNE